MKILSSLAIGVALLTASTAPTSQKRPALSESDLRPMLFNGWFLKSVFRSAKPALVELLWLRAMNAVSEPESERKNAALFQYGSHLADIDPRFYHPYLYLGINIPFKSTRGYTNGEDAVTLLNRGTKHFQNDLRLHLILGFTQFAIVKNYVEAAATYKRISTFPDAPPYAASFATRLLAQSGNTNLALELALKLADSATDEATRAEYEKRVLEIKVEAQLQKVDTAITQFKTRENRPPTDINELMAKGDYFDSLEDAMGGTISIGKDGRAATTKANRRLEIYERDE